MAVLGGWWWLMAVGGGGGGGDSTVMSHTFALHLRGSKYQYHHAR